MHAAWYLVSTPQGLTVLYLNVHSGQRHPCGTASEGMGTAALLYHLVEEGCGGWESIFLDGSLFGWVQPRLEAIH